MTPEPGPGPRARLILGTAGHIDHGKTALVRALTGVDTDRLKEEKERGITIDLGFAEFAPGDRIRFGVVDVPGHEGFIRNMVAGATGVDVVLLVVAGDEGVMPQTREHLAIVEAVGARRLVVAVTKSDLAEEAWLELVRDEVRELLEGGPFADAPVVTTSAVSEEGLEELTRVLLDQARRAGERPVDDLARLPVDRVFTVRGTGTVATGTLWSGRLRSGESVRLLPGGADVRIRGIQVHGRPVGEAVAGERTAVALAGADVEGREAPGRGTVVVTHPGWRESHILTVRLRCLAETGWMVEHGQRVRVHLGTAEVLARVAALESEAVPPGEEGWAQLRLEAPLVARSGDRFVLRSYSPVTTIAGGRVAEPVAPKRTELDQEGARRLDRLLHGEPEERLRSALDLTGWSGAERDELPVRSGLAPGSVEAALEALRQSGGAAGEGVVFGSEAVAEGRRMVTDAVVAFHRSEPLRPGFPLERLRQALPGERARFHLSQPLIDALVADGELEVAGNVARRPGFAPRPGPDQARARDRLVEIYRGAGLSPPSLRQLPDELSGRRDLPALLGLLEDEGRLVRLDEEFLAWREAVDAAARAVRDALGGREGLGPADFREVLPVSRKHLIPILNHLDTRGVTVRTEGGRNVPPGP